MDELEKLFADASAAVDRVLHPGHPPLEPPDPPEKPPPPEEVPPPREKTICWTRDGQRWTAVVSRTFHLVPHPIFPRAPGTLFDRCELTLSRGAKTWIYELGSRRGCKDLTVVNLPTETEVCALVKREIDPKDHRSKGYGFGDHVVLFCGAKDDCARQASELSALLGCPVRQVSAQERTLWYSPCPRCDDPDCPGGSLCPEWSN
ncbi:MAG: hypothetical protein HY319_05425 [Armatimonadetes bacterium]|nr:hypothetical protein [Armatimonadota bacterium]